MALTDFAPEIWSTVLNYQLYKNMVGLSVVNRDYEGEIARSGDTVHITRPGAVTVNDWAANTDLTIESPTETQLDLVIDQQKYFAFTIENIEQVQSNVELIPPYTQEAAYALADTADQFIFGKYTDADASNQGTAVAFTSSNIWAQLTAAKRNLSENNVPKTGRFMVLSPEEIELLEQATEFQRASDMGDEVSRNGFMGRAAGFDIFESNNLTEAANVRYCVYGHRIAWTFADQILNTEAVPMERRFADLVKGLHVYGMKTIKPKALGYIANDIT